MTILPPFTHQRATAAVAQVKPRLLNFSDAGTGKTRGHLDAFDRRPNRRRALVLGPLSTLQSAWGNDIEKFTPHLSYTIADAAHRKKAMESGSDIVIANHDGIKAIAKMLMADRGLRESFDELIVDEANAYKNFTGKGGADRTKALADVRHLFDYRRLLTGTPGAESVLDLWALAFLCDDGERLGKSFYAFRNQVTTPKQVGPSSQMIRWEEKPGALDIVTKRLEDITIRYAKKDCLDIPPNHTFTVYTDLPREVRDIYWQMVRESQVELENGALVNAIHAGARALKLLQICTGAVYDESHLVRLIHTERYRLVMDLVQQRGWPCVVAFNWRHEREQLVAEAEARGMRYAFIDGSVPADLRTIYIDQFQAGLLHVIFLHPLAAAHGITLTRGRSTIWASPPTRGESYLQLNARIDRAGQTQETETIQIAARNTREERAYDVMSGKVTRVNTLLDIFCQLQEAA